MNIPYQRLLTDRLLTWLLALWTATAAAQPAQHGATALAPEAEGDSLTFSLITCGQGSEIYSLFGHTAIRCQDHRRGTDVVFNYGMFDFDTPHFVLRFALGKTDYQLGVSSFSRFCAFYAYDGRSVHEQVLNLAPQEKLRLRQLLEENYRPENRQYRYNFFFDNCATRPRDLIEKAVEGTIRYARPMDEPLEQVSFRTLLHRYSSHSPWSRLGMDLCMGLGADRPITRREMEFVPFCLRDDFGEARITAPDGRERPLVVHEAVWVDLPETATGPQATDWPLWLSLLLLIGVVAPLTCRATLRRSRPSWLPDVLTLAPAGLAGCILAFLACLSSHPCVDSNWLLLAFHPLHLLCLPCVVRRLRKGAFSRYQAANFVCLTLFIIVYFLKIQTIPLTAVLLALCLWVRASGHLVWIRKQTHPCK